MNNSLYYTDKDLVDELNENLKEKDKISIDTFLAYKNGLRQADSDLMPYFVSLIKKALRKEKKELLNDLKKGENGWQARAWILERKFSEWNLKRISETDITTKGESINKKLDQLSDEELDKLITDASK